MKVPNNNDISKSNIFLYFCRARRRLFSSTCTFTVVPHMKNFVSKFKHLTMFCYLITLLIVLLIWTNLLYTTTSISFSGSSIVHEGFRSSFVPIAVILQVMHIIFNLNKCVKCNFENAHKCCALCKLNCIVKNGIVSFHNIRWEHSNVAFGRCTYLRNKVNMKNVENICKFRDTSHSYFRRIIYIMFGIQTCSSHGIFEVSWCVFCCKHVVN